MAQPPPDSVVRAHPAPPRPPRAAATDGGRVTNGPVAHPATSSLRRGDPLAGLRASGSPATAGLDVLLSGHVFFDIVFTDLPHDPAPGTEVWAAGMGSSPGGISNLAVAASRLGLRTGL